MSAKRNNLAKGEPGRPRGRTRLRPVVPQSPPRPLSQYMAEKFAPYGRVTLPGGVSVIPATARILQAKHGVARIADPRDRPALRLAPWEAAK